MTFLKQLSSLCIVGVVLSSGLANTAFAEQSVQEQIMAKVAAENAEKNKDEWREVAIENSVLMTLPHGQVVIELAPQFSPKHVAQFIRLTQEKHFDDTRFYRVIDGFVAQGGPENDSPEDRAVPLLTLEGDWKTDKNWAFTLVQNNDLFAEKTGFKDGFPIGYSPTEGKAWLTHCPGVIAMARGNDPDSASSHFYIVNGQAPRYLDRIMTIFGRVVYGMNQVQKITRTATMEGQTPVSKQEHTPIVSMRMMKDVPVAEQIHIEVKNTESKLFAQALDKRIKRDNPFFFKKPPQVLDVCQTPVLSRLVTK